jgi:hypothetical protein
MKKLTALEILSEAVNEPKNLGEPVTTQQALQAMEKHTAQFINEAEIFIDKQLNLLFQTDELKDSIRAEWNEWLELHYPKSK